MTGSSPNPCLWQVSAAPNASSASSNPSDIRHTLSWIGDSTIGRDPRCQIVLDSLVHGGVSRQHVKVGPVPDVPGKWQVCDLGSANGTFVNGQPLKGCRTLAEGDRIMLGQNGPQFIFALERATASGPPSLPPPPQPYPVPPAAFATTDRPGSGLPDYPGSNSPGSKSPGSPPGADVTLSQLFPIMSTGRDLRRKAYLVPGILTVCFVVLMFVSVGNAGLFNLVLASYIGGAAYFFVYQLCGKAKPWWLLVGTGFTTIVLLVSPVLDLFIFVFRGILPGNVPDGDSSSNFITVLVQMFFGAGLMEELLKAVPVLIVMMIGFKLRSPWRERIGVWEPLDGILLGTASAVGFTLLETLGQYVPNIVNDVTLQAGAGAGELAGLQLLIPRILGSIAGHMAYSGYLGYFIGLSVLKPKKRWQILGIGYVTASALHALWNSSGIISFLVLALVGVLSYAFLSAAILKARVLSPTRSQNFATRFTRLP